MALHVIVQSDYLCPWCYNAAVRLRRLERESAGAVRFEWRSFLLRPRPDPGRTLEQFRAYTRSWLRPAADEDAAPFRVWSTEAGPPSHSIPPHLVAKAAARLGPEAFDDVHERLLHAYFADNRDITDSATLAAIWAEAGLPPAALAAADDPAIRELVLSQHDEAIAAGVTGVPALRIDGTEIVLVGAQSLDTYRRWLARVQEILPS